MQELVLEGRAYQVGLGEEQALDIGGTVYRVAKFSDVLMRKWMAWAKSHLPDPLMEIAKIIADFPSAIQTRMYEDAKSKRDKRGTEADPETMELLTKPDGIKAALAIVLQKAQPLPDDVALDLAEKALEQHGTAKLSLLIQKSAGVIPLAESEVEREFFRSIGLDVALRSRPDQGPQDRPATAG